MTNQTDRGPLTGLRLVELAEGVAAPYAAKLLADLGAEVIKVETPRTGDPCRYEGPFRDASFGPDSGLLFNFLNTNKLGVSLDVDTSLGRELFEGLLAGADALIVSGSPQQIEARGLTHAALAPRFSRLVVTVVTPFGMDGPYRDWQAGELVAFEMSGLGFLTPESNGLRQELPPVKPGGYQALQVAGMTGAVATMQAIFGVELDGEGRGVDMSLVEPMTSFQFMNVARWLYMGDPGHRGFREGARHLFTKDGILSFFLSQPGQWQGFRDAMGDPEWARDPVLMTREGRHANEDLLLAHTQAWAADFTNEELSQLLQEHRVPALASNTVLAAANSAQIEARGFVREIPLADGSSARAPIAPYLFFGTPVPTPGPAPRLGQHNREVLCDRLGLPVEKLAHAYEAGIV